MQTLPHTDYAVAHRHGASFDSATACGVFQDLDEVLEDVCRTAWP